MDHIMCGTKFIGRVLAGVLAVAAVFASASSAAAVVAVDVGHSLAKPGSTSASGKAEFEYNRALAEDVIAELAANGIQTRAIGLDGGMDVLTARTEVARGADLFLSIHHDSVQPQYLQMADRFSGYGVFASRTNPDPLTSFSCAKAIADRLQAAGRSPSLHHAEPIKGENRPLADVQRGVYWFDDLVVLKTATQPAVLVEAAIIVNPNEDRMISDARNRRAIASAIAAGVSTCLPTAWCDAAGLCGRFQVRIR
ncbi:N-acetylmuramoyl-L-alanine amidase family protein [Ralstonia nicotianae]|uniref:N-acetylmuramoyl-L-alanine amidase family protein n=1 Tax=Ralstonia pseudosolanacearum TaxID=1310165 RepID=UPI002005A94E|nr:N-acetylmuramoyl-L-alanine amidase [Ralstonia pseudosolanacearum]MCK4120411.1 N-acetylmuramoyl-L-alanine amidase [Ralstonia pseudosolanacearum]